MQKTWQNTVEAFNAHRREAILFLIWFLVLPVFYFAVNRPIGNVHDVTIALDQYIPLRTEWILFYHTYYPLALYTAWSLLVRDARQLQRFALNLLSAEGLALITYYFYQTVVPRPEIDPVNLWDHLTLITYRADNPYNAFPSLHVITLTAVIISIWVARNIPRRRRVTVTILAALIIVSTVLVKQHVVVDILGGFIYSSVAYLGVRTGEHIKLRKQHEKTGELSKKS